MIGRLEAQIESLQKELKETNTSYQLRLEKLQTDHADCEKKHERLSAQMEIISLKFKHQVEHKALTDSQKQQIGEE